MNLWHDISAGDNLPNEVNVIIETPKWSNNKYEIDKDTGLIKLDRANYSAAPYPCDYGFVPQSYWHDDDPLDAIVMSTYPLSPGVLVEGRVVGLLKMTDDGDSDDKLIVVPVEDKRWDHAEDIGDLNEHVLKEYTHFFETYKELKGKGRTVEVHGYKSASEAQQAVTEGLELYKQQFAS